MGIPDSPTVPGPSCPTDEDLAAFLDGMLPAAERARITTHLAACESCYEIFAGAVHFQQEEALADPADKKEGRVVTFPVKKDSDARSKKPWWIGAAAAAVLAVGVGVVEYPVWFSSQPSIEDVASKPSAAQNLYSYVRKRGIDEPSDSFNDEAPRFMIGVLLVDLDVDRGQGNIDAERVAEVGRKLNKVILADAQAQVFRASAEKLSTGDAAARAQAAKSLPGQIAALEKFLDSPPSPSYTFGKWSEAGRLAAVTRTPAFFSRWPNRRIFAKLLEERFAQEEGVAEHLQAVRTITERGNFRGQDYKALTDELTAIIRHYDL